MIYTYIIYIHMYIIYVYICITGVEFLVTNSFREPRRVGACQYCFFCRIMLWMVIWVGFVDWGLTFGH
jgi:hypothetical protein